MRPRLKDLLNFSRPRTPGYGLSKGYYLSVLAAKMPLPSLAQLVEPKGSGGAVAAFGVPMDSNKGKASLAEPLQRGVYGIASLDRKTVLRLIVVSKEEAGFDAEAAARTMAGSLDPEAQARLQATWTLLQFTFEAHDPAVLPAVKLLLDVVRRAAELTEGMVGDPLSQRYLAPDQVQVVEDALPADAIVAVDTRATPDGHAVYTLGMQKLALPEFELNGVSEARVQAAKGLLYSAAQRVIDHGPVNPGDVLGASGAAFRVAPGGLDRGHWDGVPCYELVSEAVTGTDAALSAWKEHGDDRA